MNMQVTEAEYEQFAHYCRSLDLAKGWPAKDWGHYLARGHFHFGKGGTMPADAARFAPPPKAPPRPVLAPVAAVPPRPVVPPVLAAVVADRARALALIGMTAKGAEAEAECAAAIRSGTSPESYRATVAARSILDAMRGR